jgi:cell division protein FtsB
VTCDGVEGQDVQKVTTSHDIGLITAAKLVGICWAGLVPIVFPAWLIVKGEIRYQNELQDKEIASRYVAHAEYQEFRNTVQDLKIEVTKLRDAILVVGLHDAVQVQREAQKK